MPRVLAVDFGEKRIGLATSDAEGLLATPRRTILRRGDDAAAKALLRFCEEEEIEIVVFGIPCFQDGVESPFAARVRSFARKFGDKAALPVLFHEETLTSVEASRRLPRGAPREEVDRVAAQVLLEDFLEDSRAGGRR